MATIKTGDSFMGVGGGRYAEDSNGNIGRGATDSEAIAALQAAQLSQIAKNGDKKK